MAERVTDEDQSAMPAPSPVKSGWRSVMEADQDFQALDKLRRDVLGVDDTVRECDWTAWLSAWMEFRAWSDDDADSRKALTEIVVGASHDPRGIEKRRQFASWDELLSTRDGDREAARAWFVIFELDQPVTDPHEIRARAKQVSDAGRLTPLQDRTLFERHPLISEALANATKAKSYEHE